MKSDVGMRRKGWLLFGASVLLLGALLCGSLYYFQIWRPRMQEQEDLLAYMEAYARAKREAFARENGTYNDFAVDVAFLGDSLTDFYPVSNHFPQYVTVNRGISGDTTFELEERLPVSVYALKPKVAVLLIGVNNLDTAMENYEQILQGLKTNLPHTRVVVLSLTPLTGGWTSRNPQVVSHNEKIKRLAEARGYTYVDIFTPLCDGNTGTLATSFAADDVHLSSAAYDVVTDVLTPVLAAELAAWQMP